MGNLGKRLVVVILLGMATLSLHADNYVKNGDLKDGSSDWRGDGNLVYLKPDGTEGEETDPGVIPVIKVSLRSQPQAVYQEYEARDTPTTMHVKVDVYASSDFKRSADPSDYNIDWKVGGVWFWTAVVIPNADFWIRGVYSTNCYKLANLKTGAWTTVEGRFEGVTKDEDRAVYFNVPAGHGTIYLKNMVVDQ